jgi:transcriptional regulator with GAF, ATPase, and Fis domain
LNDSLEIAIIDADFARVIASNDEVSAAAHRLAVCLQDHDIEPGQRIDAHLALAQMYASVIPPTENTISTARRDVKLANETLTSIRASQAEFGKDLDARIALISNSIDSAQSQKNQIDRQREEQQRQEREKREQQRQQQEKEKKDKQQIDQSPTVPSTKSP